MVQHSAHSKINILIVLSALCLWPSSPHIAAQSPGAASDEDILTLEAPAAFAPAVGEHARRVPGSGMLVESEPSGAEVWLDGILRGTTPLQLEDSLPGPRILALEREGYRRRSSLIFVEEAQRLELYVKLERATGTIKLAPDIPQKDEKHLKLFLDGAAVQPGILEVVEGSHTIRIEAFGYRTQTSIVRVEADRETLVEGPLEAIAGEILAFSASRRVFKSTGNDSSGEDGLGTLSLSITASGPGEAEILLLDARGIQTGRALSVPVEGPETSMRWNPALHLEAGTGALEDGAVTLKISMRGSPSSKSLDLVADSRIAYAFDEAAPLAGGSMLSPHPPRSPRGAHRFSLALVPGKALMGSDPAEEALPHAIASVRLVPASRWQLDLQARVYPEGGSTGFYAGAGLGTSILYEAPFALGLWLGAGHDFAGTGTANATPFEATEGLAISLPLLLSFIADKVAATVSVTASLPQLFFSNYRFDLALGASIPAMIGPFCVSPSTRNVFTLYDGEQNTGWQHSEVGLSLAFKGSRRFASPYLFGVLRFTPHDLVLSAGIALEVSLEG